MSLIRLFPGRSSTSKVCRVAANVRNAFTSANWNIGRISAATLCAKSWIVHQIIHGNGHRCQYSSILRLSTEHPQREVPTRSQNKLDNRFSKRTDVACVFHTSLPLYGDNSTINEIYSEICTTERPYHRKEYTSHKDSFPSSQPFFDIIVRRTNVCKRIDIFPALYYGLRQSLVVGHGDERSHISTASLVGAKSVA